MKGGGDFVNKSAKAPDSHLIQCAFEFSLNYTKLAMLSFFVLFRSKG